MNEKNPQDDSRLLRTLEGVGRLLDHMPMVGFMAVGYSIFMPHLPETSPPFEAPLGSDVL